MRFKQIANEPKTFALIVDTGRGNSPYSKSRLRSKRPRQQIKHNLDNAMNWLML